MFSFQCPYFWLRHISNRAQEVGIYQDLTGADNEKMDEENVEERQGVRARNRVCCEKPHDDSGIDCRVHASEFPPRNAHDWIVDVYLPRWVKLSTNVAR